MKRRELLLVTSGSVAGLVLAACAREPIGRQAIPVTTVYSQEPKGLQGSAWIAEGVGGVSHSEPQLTVEEHEDRVVLTMTAYNSARPGDSQIALGKLLRVEFTLKEPRAGRRFVNEKGETVQVLPELPG